MPKNIRKWGSGFLPAELSTYLAAKKGGQDFTPPLIWWYKVPGFTYCPGQQPAGKVMQEHKKRN